MKRSGGGGQNAEKFIGRDVVEMKGTHTPCITMDNKYDISKIEWRQGTERIDWSSA